MFDKIKDFFKEKAQVNLVKSMLSNIGFDVKSIIPTVEKMLLDWLKQQQNEAGARLVLVGYPDETETNFIVCLHKQTETGLVPWKQFPLTDFENILTNLENLENLENGATNAEFAQLPASPAIRPEIAGANHTDTIGAEPATTSDTGTGTTPANTTATAEPAGA